MFTVKSRKNFKIIAGVLSTVICSQFLGVNNSAQAAEKLTVRYGPLEESASLAELKEAAETGELPASLGTYAKRLNEKQRNFLLQGLKIKVPVDVVTINRLLNTQLGQTVVKEIATALDREDEAGVQAISAGLILGANSRQGLSVLSFIEAYPSKSLKINLPQALTVGRSLNMAFWRTQQLMFAIAPRINPNTIRFPRSFDPTKPGNAQVEILNLNLDDENRQRNIPVDIYWSNSVNRSKPLIVFSHGYGTVRTDLKYLAEHLASHGYVVAALEHPGSNFTASQGKDGLKPQEFLARPQDVSFVIDELAKINQATENPLQGKLATDNVMVVGYSFGGTTALALAGGEFQIASLRQTCEERANKLTSLQGFLCVAKDLPEDSYQLRDERVKKIVAVTPATSWLFGETGLTKVQVPTLMFTGSSDNVTPTLSEHVGSFAKIPSPKWLAAAVGATHWSVVDTSITDSEAGQKHLAANSREVAGEKTTDVRRYLQALTLAMAAQSTPEARQYAAVLTPAYAQVASTKLFPFRIVTELPAAARGLRN
jgi:predicted dienelactone hydrolase